LRKDAMELGEDRVLVGDEVDDAVRDDDVEAQVRERQVLGLAFDELHVLDSHGRGGRTRLGKHLLGHVDPDHPARPADHLRGDERIGARPAAQVEYALPGEQPS
jgi:hypothetical protein